MDTNIIDNKKALPIVGLIHVYTSKAGNTADSELHVALLIATEHYWTYMYNLTQLTLHACTCTCAADEAWYWPKRVLRTG